MRSDKTRQKAGTGGRAIFPALTDEEIVFPSPALSLFRRRRQERNLGLINTGASGYGLRRRRRRKNRDKKNIMGLWEEGRK